jgi:hypothetical protein
MIGRGKWGTWRKPAPVPLCPPQTPHAAHTRTRAAAVGSQRLTAELRHGPCVTYYFLLWSPMAFKVSGNLVRTYLREFWGPATNDAITTLLMCCHVGSVWNTRIVTTQTEWKTDHLAISSRIKHTDKERVSSFWRSWYVSYRAIGPLHCYWIFNHGCGIYGRQCLFHGPECTVVQMCCLVAYLLCADINRLCIKILWRIDQLLSSDFVNKSSYCAIGE